MVEAYLNKLFQEASYLPLSEIDPKARSDAAVQFDLAAIYTALLARTPERMDERQTRQMIMPQEPYANRHARWWSI